MGILCTHIVGYGTNKSEQRFLSVSFVSVRVACEKGQLSCLICMCVLGLALISAHCGNDNQSLTTKHQVICISKHAITTQNYLPLRSKNRTGTCGSMPAGGHQLAGAPGMPHPAAGTSTEFRSSVNEIH